MDIELHYGWHDCVFDDAKEIGRLLGIEIDQIYFSGFWSQGDGACFTGRYSYAKGAAKAIRAHVPQETELHRIADALQTLQRRNFYGLEARIAHRGHYYHEMCTDNDVSDDRDACTADDADELTELLRDYMVWIYRTLEREHEYQTKWQAARVIEDAREEIADARARHTELVREIRAARSAVTSNADAICDTLRACLADLRSDIRAAHKRIAETLETYGEEILGPDYN